MTILKLKQKNAGQIFERIKKDPILVFVQKFIKEYPKAKIYLVGGAVRDALLNKEIKDWDFLIAGLGVKKIDKFLRRYGQVKLTDTRTFGVFKFYPERRRRVNPEKVRRNRADERIPWNNSGEIDIALPRKETYEKGKRKKHAKVEFDPRLPIEEDLARRDFTINAIAMEVKSQKSKVKSKEFIDPFDGIRDLKNKIIRAVRNPEDRFQEDPSRILRALRFAVQLNFKIENKTWQALKKLMPEINKWFIESRIVPRLLPRRQIVPESLLQSKKQRVAREIIAEEFLKAFSIDPVKTLDLYNESGALKELMPEIEELKKVEQGTRWHSEGDVYTHTRLALENLKLKGQKSKVKYKKGSSLALKVALLFHDLGKKKTQIKKSKQKITFHGHDLAGIEICSKIIKRLRLDSLDKRSPYYLDPAKVKWLIRHHMLILNTEPEKIRENTLEKYFFREDRWGDDLLALTLADAKASRPINGRLDLTKYNRIVKRIKKLEKKHRMNGRKTLPPALLNGREIMKALNLPPGRLIGKIKEELRVWQLRRKIGNKKEALGKLKEIKKEVEG